LARLGLIAWRDIEYSSISGLLLARFERVAGSQSTVIVGATDLCEKDSCVLKLATRARPCAKAGTARERVIAGA